MRRLLRHLMLRINYHLRRLMLPLYLRLRKVDLDTLYIDPNLAVYTVARNDPSLEGRSWHLGEISSGDWDLNGYPVREHGHIYIILKRRMDDKIEYEQIPEYLENIQEIENGGSVDNCTTQEAYVNKWRHIERLYWAIKKNGYKTQVELGTGDLLNEIRIQIGRKGDLLLEEGIHRLAIAQLLNLDRVPVIVSRRHKDWAGLRQDLISIVMKRGFFHQPFNHPDLDILPQLYGNDMKDQAMYGNERWDFIVTSLPVTQGTVLDIGAYFGYFCHRFEDLGVECYAVEPDRENLAILKRYREMMGKHFTVWEKSLFEIDHYEFDIVLALNVFHHLVKNKDDHDRLIEFLRRMRCRAMYFEPHKNLEAGSYKSFSDEEFIDFVISNSLLSRSRLLGCAKEKRNVYLLTV